MAVAVGLANAAAFGTVYTFGAFFDAMADELDVGRGSTAVVFGITVLLFFGFGVVSGPLSDRFGGRRLLVAGSVLLVAGLAATSRVDGIAAGYVTYGLGVGLGGGLFVTPLYATAGLWFVRRRALALGVVSAGNGLGTLVMVPSAERLIDAHGWRDAYLWLALIVGVALTVAAVVVVRPPRVEGAAPPPSLRQRLALLGPQPAFRAMMVSTLLMAVSLFTAFAFIVPFAEDDGISASGAAAVVGLVGASSILGRLLIGLGVARWGSVRLLQLSLGVQPVAYVIWMVAGDRFAWLVVFAVVLGFSYGGFVSLGPEVTAHLFGVAGLGATFGLLFLATGVGGFIGPPVTGVLSDLAGGHVVPIGFVLAVNLVAVAVTLTVPTEPVLHDGPVEVRST